jgi:mannosyltransferase
MRSLLNAESQVASLRSLEEGPSSAGAWSFLVAAFLAAFYFVTSLYISSHRLLWIDEIATVRFARLPSWLAIWKTLSEGAEGMPPTYFMITRIFDNSFGHSEVAIRLPSVLALTAGLLLVFDCARRLTDGLHGLIALSVLICSFLPYYGHEARSYALYFMLSALALWIWIHTRDDKPSAAVLFGVVLFLSVTMHYYALLCLVPYAFWEIWHWKPWRLPSQRMIGGVAGVLCAAVLLWKPIQAQRHQFPPNFWARPSPDVLPAAYSDLFPDFLFLLALVMLWIAFVGRRDEVLPLPPMQSGERIGWFFLFIPLAGYLLSEITHVFQLRYLICTLPGVAVAISCCLWRHFHKAWRVSAGVFLILATWGLAKQVIATRDPNRFYVSPIKQMLSLENTLRSDGKRYFVVSNQARYGEALYYSKHSDDYALLLLPSVDPARMHQTTILMQYYPMRIWTLEDLKKHAHESALLFPFPGLSDALKQAGIEIDASPSKSSQVVYLK